MWGNRRTCANDRSIDRTDLSVCEGIKQKLVEKQQLHNARSYGLEKKFSILFYCQWKEFLRNGVANTPCNFSRKNVKALGGLKRWASRNDSQNKTVQLVPRGWWGIRRLLLNLQSSGMHSVAPSWEQQVCRNHCCSNSPDTMVPVTHRGTELWENPTFLYPCYQQQTTKAKGNQPLLHFGLPNI